jgi:predicted dehydrogenase
MTDLSAADVNRRSFLCASAALALPASSYARVPGANERVGIGFIGFGLIGKRHVLTFKDLKSAHPVAVAEAHRGRLDEAKTLIGGPVKGYADFRKLLEDRDIHAVVVATPDHWHALMTMLACAAGKDVYIEKPLTLFVREGRWMIDVARRHKSVVQVGTQQRSAKHYQKARDLLQAGHLGKVVSVRAQAVRNITPGFGKPPDQAAPAELNWDLWLGPAPQRRYNPNRALYHFRWFWDYSGGQMTNLGFHSLDVVDWVLGLGRLGAVSSAGGRFCLQDNGETPDTQDALFELDGWTAVVSLREGSRGPVAAYPLEFFGTKGSLGLSRRGFQVTPDLDTPPANAIPQFAGAHPAGGPKRVKLAQPARPRTRAVEDRSGDSAVQFREHAQNFLDCVRSRKTPVADLESAQRTAIACHLANLSLRLGRKLRWDAQKETVEDDREAVAALCRPYRRPWDRELKALGVG